jgi:hypothetical protein
MTSLLAQVSVDSILQSSKQAQQEIKAYNQLLGLRIQLQRSVQLVNSWPPLLQSQSEEEEDAENPLQSIGIPDEEIVANLKQSLKSLIRIGISQEGIKRDVEEGELNDIDWVEDIESVWEIIESNQSNLFKNNWEPTLNKMQEKALFTMNGAKSQTLKVFNKSFWDKVRSNLYTKISCLLF